jgi:hypothetical protein
MGIEPVACTDDDVHAQIIGALRSYARMPEQTQGTPAAE